MALSQIAIRHKIQVIPGDKILVPGCEPPSSVSTIRFAANYALSGCEGGLIDLQDALLAIPGSWVEYGVNYGPQIFKQRWFVLPDMYVDCKCDTSDYYAMLRDVPKSNTEQEDEDGCGNELMYADWCGDGVGNCNTGNCSDDTLPVAPDSSGGGGCNRTTKAPYFKERAVGIFRGPEQNPYFEEGGPGPIARGVLPQVPPNQRD